MRRLGESSASKRLENIGIEHIGIGTFYYIASTAVIGIMNYAGHGRGDNELALFFGLLAGTLMTLTIAASLWLGVRDAMVESQGGPTVAVVLLAMICSCLSMFPWGQGLFFACAVLTGVSCSLLVTAWERGLSRSPLRQDLFVMPPSLIVAVLCYFVYRVLSFASTMAADSWHVTVGVVGMLALLLAYSPEYRDMEQEEGRSRAFLILGSVAAVFAMGGGLIAFLSGFPGSAERATFTPYFLLEVAGSVLIVLFCVLGGRSLCGGLMPKRGLPSLFSRFVPPGLLLCLGALSGIVLVESGGNGLLWEASVWVLVVAALAFGMRTSLYLVNGMVVGVLFEAWCVGQALVLACALAPGLRAFGGAAAVVAVLYLVATAKLLKRAPMMPLDEGGDKAPPPDELAMQDSRNDVELSDEEEKASPEQEICCQIGEEYGLTAREVEVLCLIAEGRSARFIADALVISYNTARSHMRNVYEKLGIHAKQEVITLVRSWE